MAADPFKFYWTNFRLPQLHWYQSEPHSPMTNFTYPRGNAPSQPGPIGADPRQTESRADPLPSALTFGSTKTQPDHASTGGSDYDQPEDTRILDRCHALGLTLLQAMQLANADNPTDPQALFRLLRLDFATYNPLVSRRKHDALQVAAMSSSVSYRGTLTREGLLAILTTELVPAEFAAHIGHFLDEVSASVVLFSVVEAAQESGMPTRQIWANVARLALRYSDYRQMLWATFADGDTSLSR